MRFNWCMWEWNSIYANILFCSIEQPKENGLSEAYVKHLFNKNHQLAFAKLMSNMNEPCSDSGMYAFENSHYTFGHNTPVTGHSFENRIDLWISSFKCFHCLSALSRPKCVRCTWLACFHILTDSLNIKIYILQWNSMRASFKQFKFRNRLRNEVSDRVCELSAVYLRVIDSFILKCHSLLTVLRIVKQ